MCERPAPSRRLVAASARPGSIRTVAAKETYEVFLRVADEGEACLYLIEHWFRDKPERGEVASLFDDAKQTFRLLYPDAEAVDFSVETRRLRPNDDHRPFPPTDDAD
jgi:hypothetical protein